MSVSLKIPQCNHRHNMRDRKKQETKTKQNAQRDWLTTNNIRHLLLYWCSSLGSDLVLFLRKGLFPQWANWPPPYCNDDSGKWLHLYTAYIRSIIQICLSFTRTLTHHARCWPDPRALWQVDRRSWGLNCLLSVDDPFYLLSHSHPTTSVSPPLFGLLYRLPCNTVWTLMVPRILLTLAIPTIFL